MDRNKKVAFMVTFLFKLNKGIVTPTRRGEIRHVSY